METTEEKVAQLSETEMLQKLHDSIVETIRLAISRLYHLPSTEIRIADPSLEEISKLCRLFNKIVEGTNIDGHFTEAIEVINEAADAAHREDSQCLIDCAYHLEDFLSRMDR